MSIGFRRDDEPRRWEAMQRPSGLWIAGDQWLDRLDLVDEDERTGDVFASTERGGTGPTSWEGDYELPALPRYSGQRPCSGRVNRLAGTHPRGHGRSSLETSDRHEAPGT